jgi:hypothetical protein
VVGCETQRLSIRAQLPENTDLAVVWVLAAESCEDADLMDAPVVAVVQRDVMTPRACGEVSVAPGRYVAVAVGFLNDTARCDAHSFGCEPFLVENGAVPLVEIGTEPSTSPECQVLPFCAPYAARGRSCRDAVAMDPCRQITGTAP